MTYRFVIVVIACCVGATQSYRSAYDDTNNGGHNGSYDIFTCCSQVYGSCKASCEGLSLVKLATEKNQKELQDVRKFCSLTQLDFWNCINRTLKAVARGAQWPGRSCCSLAGSPRCQNVCATAIQRSDLRQGCRQSDEQEMFACIEHQEYGDECCGNARTADCLQSCKSIFQYRRFPTKEERQQVLQACEGNHPRIVECVHNYTDTTETSGNLRKYLPCCEYSGVKPCQKTCREALKQGRSTQETFDTMELSCGPVLPYDPMWQCFLQADQTLHQPVNTDVAVSRINQIGLDSAKLHCCPKSTSTKCRRLCEMTYSSDWADVRDDFETNCYMQIGEALLRQCLDEVDEPCELGCNGLSFCSNFNNRPTELFRSCNLQADQAARAAVTLWQRVGFLTLLGMDLPIRRNVSECSLEMWRAVACMLQTKPCTRSAHANQICREDCYDLLSKCIDWQAMKSGHSVTSLCQKLSNDDGASQCISIQPYLEPSDNPWHAGAKPEITTPCKPRSPCNASQVCHVNRDGGSGHTCLRGCPLGEASSYYVAEGTYIRVPVSTNQKGCLNVCRCGASGRLEKCQPLPCFTYSSCSLGGRRIDHGAWFYVECNICSCYAGEITCTKKQCQIPGIGDSSFTSLPCNCPPHHVAVCGRNGNTYPSACIAKCVGLQDADIEFGPCNARSACASHPCGGNSVCVPIGSVCLSNMHRPCPQYQCVNITTPCPPGEHATDANHKVYPSMCHLLKAKASFAFRGHFKRGVCDDHIKGPVCGHNGVTYRSECEAWSEFALVDYPGECREVGLVTSSLGARCTSVKCAHLPFDICSGIVPPGACCPICGTGVRIVYSRKQIDRALYALGGKNMDVLTLRSVLKALADLIQVSQCHLSGYLTFETDIFLSVEPLDKAPTFLQIETCAREAEKIATLIATQSHRVTSDLRLSSLTVATIVNDVAATSGTVVSQALSVLSYLVLMLALIRFTHKIWR